MFSWQLIIPFAILHIDLWIPETYTGSKSNMKLMNVMCDMSQFVDVVPIPDEPSATLADYFFQHVLINFGLRHLVVLDDGIKYLILTMIYLQSITISDYQWNTSTAF